MPGTQGGPMMNVIAGKALTFELAGRPEFRRYQQQIVANARAMADEFTQRGFTVVSGGTDNHMFLLDLTGLGLSGAKACRRLALANITANKNAIPNDPRKPSEASGIRLGTPALTSRGMTEAQMRTIAAWIAEILRAADPPAAAARVKGQVLELCASFPVPH
jgi:glycine hydroxymethyltransferase